MRFAFVRMTLARALTVGTVLSYTMFYIRSEFITADPPTYKCGYEARDCNGAYKCEEYICRGI